MSQTLYQTTSKYIAACCEDSVNTQGFFTKIKLQDIGLE